MVKEGIRLDKKQLDGLRISEKVKTREKLRRSEEVR